MNNPEPTSSTIAYFENESGQHFPVLESGHPNIEIQGETEIPRLNIQTVTDFLKNRISKNCESDFPNIAPHTKPF